MTLVSPIRVLGPAVVVAAAWLALSAWLGGQIGEVTEAAEAADRQAAAQRRAAADLRQFSAVGGDAIKAADRIAVAIPPRPDIPQVIELLASVGRTASVDVETISPKPTPLALAPSAAAADPAAGSDQPLSRIEVAVRGTGSYEATMTYFDLVSQAERLFVIRSIELAAGDTGGTVRFAVDLDAFTTNRADPVGPTAGAASPPTLEEG